MKVAISTLLLLAMVCPAVGQETSIVHSNQEDSLRGRRELQNKITTRCWEQCTDLKLNARECQELIEAELGGPSLQNHVIKDLEIKVRTPRSPAVFAKTYWLLGIPTDINGNVSCDANYGIVRMPWKWEIPYGSSTIKVPLPEVSCVGMTAVECCAAFKDEMKAANIPLEDANGNCLTCYAHQQPLEPIIDPKGNGSTLAYLDKQWYVAGQKCKDVALSPAQVQAADSALESALVADAATIQAILDANSSSCSALNALVASLLMNARTLPYEMKLVGDLQQLLCHKCKTGSGTFNPLPADIKKILMKLLQIQDASIASDRQCIIIYTDAQGHVIEPPKIGGSIEGIDWNLDDKCDESQCDPNYPANEPFCEGGDFDPASPEFQCTGPPSAMEKTPEEMPGYAITLKTYDNTKVSSKGKKTSSFTYQVCSTEEPISHVIVSWLGKCILDGYSYKGATFDEFSRGYRIHQDPYTCLVGFKFDEWWGNVINLPACRELTLRVDGHVDLVDVDAAIYVEGKFAKYQVQGPDCSACNY